MGIMRDFPFHPALWFRNATLVVTFMETTDFFRNFMLQMSIPYFFYQTSDN